MAFLRQRSGRWSLRGYRSKLRQVATLATLNFPPVSYLVTQLFLELGFSSLCFSPSLLETELCMRGAPSWGCVTCSSHATPGRRSTRHSRSTINRYSAPYSWGELKSASACVERLPVAFARFGRWSLRGYRSKLCQVMLSRALSLYRSLSLS